ncbi:hypothetical protein F1649_09140 [Arcticibacter tournemirensis]|uniref:Uncharacterized protein n=1 Tax=Arcticibacter tournemirensis TaxID=699437 RepID=A0A5M9H8T7_9SPHI|nr:hypothetical protein F1649_09140 [Arcticibacter tournemirensis]
MLSESWLSAISLRRSRLNFQLSTFNFQLSTFNFQPSTFNFQQLNVQLTSYSTSSLLADVSGWLKSSLHH